MSKIKRAVSLVISFSIVLGCFGVIATKLPQDLPVTESGKVNSPVLGVIEEKPIVNEDVIITDEEEYDYINEDLVFDDTFQTNSSQAANVADINDYSLLSQTDKKYMKLTVDNASDASNELKIIFSEAGKNSFTLRQGYYLQYDVMMEGNTAGTGFIDLYSDNGLASLSDSQYCYDTEGIRAAGDSSLAGLANNRWYSRKIQIPQEMYNTNIFRWVVVQKSTAPDARTVTYFDNVRITDASGNTLLAVNLSENTLMCSTIQKRGVYNYRLSMNPLANEQVRPQGDYLRLLVSSYELEEGTSAYVNYAFSTKGRDTYTIKNGDVLVYKIKSVNPFAEGVASVDIRFTDKTWLTDSDIADQNGNAIWPSTDIGKDAGGCWYYRAVEIPAKYVGKTVDYFTIKTLNTMSMADYEVQLADVKIINNDKTSLLVYGGGDITEGGLAALRNAFVEVYRSHGASDVGEPTGDYLRGYLYTQRSERVSAQLLLSEKTYTVKEGDYLEYDVTTDDALMLNSGFGIDIELESGNYPSDYYWKDQNGISALPSMDISNYTSGQWYHRKIAIGDMEGEEIVKWLISGEINNGLANVRIDGTSYTFGLDNIRITNNGKTVLSLYENGRFSAKMLDMRNAGCAYVASAPYETITPIYKVPTFTIPANDAPVIAYNVKDFGAKADGTTDDTAAFQSALYAAEAIGGGVVFAPAGRYVIKGNLYVPSTVQLRGEWAAPNATYNGTLLMAYADKGNVDGLPFITLGRSASASHLAVWYPEQDPVSPQEFPWTFQNHYGESTIYNVTMYNSFRGIKYGNGSSSSQIAENIYGTFLNRGIEIDCNFDLPRYNNVYATPDIWVNSGLANAPTGGDIQTLKEHMVANLEVLRTGRVDGLSLYNINIDFAKTGLLFDQAELIEPMTVADSGAFCNLTKFNIQNVETAFDMRFMAMMGLVASKGTVATNMGSNPAGIIVGANYHANLSFANTAFFSTGNNVISDGNAMLSFQNTAFSPGGGKDAMVLNRGMINVNGCQFNGNVSVAPTFNGGTANSNNGLNVVGSTDKIAVNPAQYAFSDINDDISTFDDRACPLPGTTTVYNAQDYGAKADGTTDATAAIQAAIDAAYANGGGIVYMPGGKYRIDGSITVRERVELRGVLHSFHHTTAGATILEIYGGYNNESAAPTFLVKEGGGLSGMTFYYPEQPCWNVVPFPWAVRTDGNGCFVTNTSFVNAYRGIDSFTCYNDKHYIANIGGTFIASGIYVGNSPTYGTLKNTQMVTHFWTSYPDYGCIPEVDGQNVMDTVTFNQVASRLTAYMFGDVKNESSLASFTWIAMIGAQFVDQGAGGANAEFINFGTDGPYVNYDVVKAEDLVFVSPYMFVHYFSNYSPDRTFVRTQATNTGNVTLFNVLGHQNGRAGQNFILGGGNVVIQQFAADAADGSNAAIYGGDVKLIGITNRVAYLEMGPSNSVQQSGGNLLVVGWIDIDRDFTTNLGGGNRTIAGAIRLNKF